jgi:hypothetical protein
MSGEKLEISKAMLQAYIIGIIAAQYLHANIEVQQPAAGAQRRSGPASREQQEAHVTWG